MVQEKYKESEKNVTSDFQELQAGWNRWSAGQLECICETNQYSTVMMSIGYYTSAKSHSM